MIVYIIYSLADDSYYVGYCQENLEERLVKHCTGFYDNSYTKKATDWQLFWHLQCSSKQQALAIEKHIKAMKSRKYIIDLKKYPTISEKLLLKYL